MNLNRAEGLTLLEDVLSKLPVDNKTHVILAPSFVYLHKVAKMCTDIPKVVAASQDCSANEKGAFTGEVSASMIASCSARYVVLGHSERRTNFTETNELLKTKVGQVFANDLKVIFCCGESLAQRENGVHFDWIKSQISESLFHLSVEEFKNIVIAYEPIWAIGSGLNATPEIIEDVHKYIRNWFKMNYSETVSKKMCIQYGGSVNSNNFTDILNQDNVNGVLIGGASLDSYKFSKIMNY